MENKKSNLYTKTGDRGTTSLTGGQRVKKSDLRLDCYGTVDELNSFLGLLSSRPMPAADKELLQSIQNSLFVVGSYLATAAEDADIKARFAVKLEDVRLLEKAVDRLDAEVPPMSGFILPAGGETAAMAHVCRTICRRLERLLFAFNEIEPVEGHLFAYINRLSDLLFAMARSACHREGYEEVLWKVN